MRLGRSLVVGSAAALLLLSVVVPATVAYQGQVANQVTVSRAAGVIYCNVPVTVTATVLDAHGTPVDGQTVVWSFGGGLLAGDQIGPISATTNASGVATTTVTLACSAGNRTVVGTADPASGRVVISPILVAGASATPGLSATPGASSTGTPPPTASSLAAGTTDGSAPLWVLAVVGICLIGLIVGFFVSVRRRFVARG